MDPRRPWEAFGDRISFWVGGVDTQRALPFTPPEEVRPEVRHRFRIFGCGGGFIFNTTNNVQARVPPENPLAL